MSRPHALVPLLVLALAVTWCSTSAAAGPSPAGAPPPFTAPGAEKGAEKRAVEPLQAPVGASAAGAGITTGERELPRQVAPALDGLGGGMAAALHPETGAVDTGPFVLTHVRWQRGADGKPAAATGLLAVPAPVRALTDLPAEWPARVLFKDGTPLMAQLGALDELAIGAAGYRQVLRPEKRGRPLDVGITPGGGLVGRAVVDQLPVRGGWSPALPLSVRLETSSDGHVDLVLSGIKGARVFHRFGPESAPRPPGGTRAVTARTWAGSDLWIATTGALLPGVELEPEAGWPHGTWPAPVGNLLQDQIALGLGAGRVDLAPVGDARFQYLTLWLDPASGRVTGAGEALLHVDERELRLARRVWTVPGDALGALEATSDGVRVTVEVDPTGHAAPARVEGPPAVTARLIRLAAARPAAETAPHLELTADVGVGERHTRAPFRVERSGTGPRLVLQVPPGPQGLGALPVALGDGARLTLTPERIALVSADDPGASEKSAAHAPIGVELEGDGALTFAEVTLSGPAILRSATAGALDLAVTPSRSRPPELPDALVIDFARTTGHFADGKLALTGAVFMPVPAVLSRLVDAFDPLPRRLSGRLTASATAVDIVADAPATLVDAPEAALSVRTTTLALHHATGKPGWSPALLARIQTAAGSQETRLEPGGADRACAGPLARPARLAAEGLSVAADGLTICLSVKDRIPAVALSATRTELEGWHGNVDSLRLVRGERGWTPVLDGTPAALDLAGAHLTFGHGPVERAGATVRWRGAAEIALPDALASAAAPLLVLPAKLAGTADLRGDTLRGDTLRGDTLRGDTVRVTASLASPSGPLHADLWPGVTLRLDTLTLGRDGGPALLTLTGALVTAHEELPGALVYHPPAGAAPARLMFTAAPGARAHLPVPGAAITAQLTDLALELARDGDVPFTRLAGSGSVTSGTLTRSGRVSIAWSQSGHGRLEVDSPDLVLEAGPLGITPLTLAVDLPRPSDDVSLPVDVKVELPASWPGLGGQEFRARVETGADGSWRLKPTGPLPGPHAVGTLPVRVALTGLEARHTQDGFSLAGAARLAFEPPLAGLLTGAGAPPEMPARLLWQAGRVTLAVDAGDAALAATRFSLPPFGQARVTPRGLTLTFAGPHPEPILMVAARLELDAGPAHADLLVTGNVGEGGLQLDLTAPDRTRGAVTVRLPGVLDATARDLVFRELAPASELSPATGAVSADLSVLLGGPTFGLRISSERVHHILSTAAPPAGLLFFDRLDLEARLFGLPLEGSLSWPLPPGPELRRAAWWRDALEALSTSLRAGLPEPLVALVAEGRAGPTIGPITLGLPAAAARLLPDLPLASMGGRSVARLTLVDRPVPLLDGGNLARSLRAALDAAGELARACRGEVARLVALVPPAHRSGLTRLRLPQLSGRASWALEPVRTATAAARAPALPALARLTALGAHGLAGLPTLAETAQGRARLINPAGNRNQKLPTQISDAWKSLREPITEALELMEHASPSAGDFDPRRALERHLERMRLARGGVIANAGTLDTADHRVTLEVTGATPPVVVRSGTTTLLAQSVPLLTTTTYAVPGQGTLELGSAVELAGQTPLVSVKARLLPLTGPEHQLAQAAWTRARARWLAARDAHEGWQKRAGAEAAWQARQRARDDWREAVNAYAIWVRRAGARDQWVHEATAWIAWSGGLRACMKDSAAAWTGDPIPPACRAALAAKLGAEPTDPGPPPGEAGEPPPAPSPEPPPPAGPRPPLSGEPPPPPGDEPPPPMRPNRPVVDLGIVASLPLEAAHPRWRVTYHLGDLREMSVTFTDLGTVKFSAPSGVRFTTIHPRARLASLRAILTALAPLAPWVFDAEATPYRLGLAAWNQALIGWRDRLKSVRIDGAQVIVDLTGGARLTLALDELRAGDADDLARFVYDEDRRELRAPLGQPGPDGTDAKDLTVFSADADTRRLLADHARQREQLEPSTLERLERLGLNLDGAPLAVRRLHLLYDEGPLRAVLLPGRLVVLEGATGTPLFTVDRGSLDELARVQAGGAPGDLEDYPANAGTYLAHAGPATVTRDVIPDDVVPRALGQTLPVTTVVDLHLALGSHVLERSFTVLQPAALRGRYYVHETGQLEGTLATPAGPLAIEASADRATATVPLVPAAGLARPCVTVRWDGDLHFTASVTTADGQTRPATLGRAPNGTLSGALTYPTGRATAGGLILAGEVAQDVPHRALQLALRAPLADGAATFTGPVDATLGGRHLDAARFRLDADEGLAVSGDMWWHAARVHLEGRSGTAGAALSGDFVNLAGETGVQGTLALVPGARAARVNGQLQVDGTAVTQGPLAMEAKTATAALDLASAPAGLDGALRVVAHDAPEPPTLRFEGEAYLDTPVGRLAAPLISRLDADGTAHGRIGSLSLSADLSTLSVTVQPAQPSNSAAKRMPPPADE